ncbi:hypothetical protein CEUSTIGMA_g179.t1 [Chlamydomonas eustigma]|uniref:Uncharacterized protein n=1 Tax=Chlamydomonas eustigma TaxID=1157962 RepID=A0A250WPH8_9CHLO|nr:hypothetical protein CEUSTIGMA_g179.t1 [Chlamydomonas eustigma]|eukprot:GAX72723.1 hypothetical protein CEUSTIGMA_g179.t1 [Chlamydomonas eustigma]
MFVEKNEASPLLDTEGVVLGIYYHLWLKDHHGNSCDVNLPHTVIFHNSKPQSWYFTSLKQNKLMKKRQSQLQSHSMSEAFTSGQQQEVSAWFSGVMTRLESTAQNRERRIGSLNKDGDGEEGDNEDLALEYLSPERAKSVLEQGPSGLARKEEVHDGVLQRFVEPREERDSLIRVVWSPNAAFFEKRTNRSRLAASEHLPQVPFQERIATYLGSIMSHDNLTITDGVLKTRLEQQCKAIALHLRDVSKGSTQVARMELYFKIDVNNRIWFLYCYSMRLSKILPLRALFGDNAEEGGLYEIKDLFQSEQVHVAELQQQATDDLEGDYEFLCCMTGKMFPIAQRIKVTYKQLIQHWFTTSAQLAEENERLNSMDTIPPAIKRSNPSLSRDFYLQQRSQPMFLQNSAFVCPEAARLLSRETLKELTRSYSAAHRPYSAGMSTHVTDRHLRKEVGSSFRPISAHTGFIPPPRHPSATLTHPTLLNAPTPLLPQHPTGAIPRQHQQQIRSRQRAMSASVPSQRGGILIPSALMPKSVTQPLGLMDRVGLQSISEGQVIESAKRSLCSASMSKASATNKVPSLSIWSKSARTGGHQLSIWSKSARTGGHQLQDLEQSTDAPPASSSPYARPALLSLEVQRPSLTTNEAETLRELSEAYSQAENLTQELLLKANSFLRSGTTGLIPPSGVGALRSSSAHVRRSGGNNGQVKSSFAIPSWQKTSPIFNKSIQPVGWLVNSAFIDEEEEEIEEGAAVEHLRPKTSVGINSCATVLTATLGAIGQTEVERKRSDATALLVGSSATWDSTQRVYQKPEMKLWSPECSEIMQNVQNDFLTDAEAELLAEVLHGV